MDKYGIISITNLENEIADYIHMRDGWKKNTPNWEVYDLVIRELSKLKDQCSKLPSAGDCFNAARIIDGVGKDYGYDYSDFNDYITNYKP